VEADVPSGSIDSVHLNEPHKTVRLRLRSFARFRPDVAKNLLQTTAAEK
jgi:hypothetical protein